jgi:malate dehydrogenase (oxaloacetate-decarboxylating)(NADP+)
MSKKFERAKFTDQEALDFHAHGKPGKLEIHPTKPMATRRDLSLAYSPGVAVPVQAIADNPGTVYDYTSKGNMVAVISNGTAILGMGALGAAASKPVMEGCRFHRSRSRHHRCRCLRQLCALSRHRIRRHQP